MSKEASPLESKPLALWRKVHDDQSRLLKLANLLPMYFSEYQKELQQILKGCTVIFYQKGKETSKLHLINWKIVSMP